MARRRYISTEISVDKRIAALAEKHGDFAALLYTWMIPHAGDDCSITGDPEELLMLVVPGLRSKSIDDVKSALDAMVALGLIVPEGEDYLFPPEAFYRYQSYINANNRRAPEIAAKRRRSPKNAASPSPPPPPPVSPSPSPSPTPPTQPRARGKAKAKPPGAAGPFTAAEVEAWKQNKTTAVHCYEKLFGTGSINGFIAPRLKAIDDGWDDECIVHCFDEAAKARARSMTLVDTILERHKAEGCYAGKPQTPGTANGGGMAGARSLTDSDRAALDRLGVGAPREYVLD